MFALFFVLVYLAVGHSSAPIVIDDTPAAPAHRTATITQIKGRPSTKNIHSILNLQWSSPYLFIFKMNTLKILLMCLPTKLLTS